MDIVTKEIITQIESFLEFGDKTVGTAHGGYYSKGGFAYETVKKFVDEYYRLISLPSTDEIIASVKNDMINEGLNNYEACYHSNLYCEKYALLPAQTVIEHMLEILEKEPRMDCWVATVLGEISDHYYIYGITDILPRLKNVGF